MTAQKAANTQAATVPAPPPAAAAAATAEVDPGKAKQLTQAVAEQVRTLANSNAMLSVNANLKFYHFKKKKKSIIVCYRKWFQLFVRSFQPFCFVVWMSSCNGKTNQMFSERKRSPKTEFHVFQNLVDLNNGCF